MPVQQVPPYHLWLH